MPLKLPLALLLRLLLLLTCARVWCGGNKGRKCESRPLQAESYFLPSLPPSPPPSLPPYLRSIRLAGGKDTRLEDVSLGHGSAGEDLVGTNDKGEEGDGLACSEGGREGTSEEGEGRRKSLHRPETKPNSLNGTSPPSFPPSLPPSLLRLPAGGETKTLCSRM